MNRMDRIILIQPSRSSCSSCLLFSLLCRVRCLGRSHGLPKTVKPWHPPPNPKPQTPNPGLAWECEAQPGAVICV